MELFYTQNTQRKVLLPEDVGREAKKRSSLEEKIPTAVSLSELITSFRNLIIGCKPVAGGRSGRQSIGEAIGRQSSPQTQREFPNNLRIPKMQKVTLH